MIYITGFFLIIGITVLAALGHYVETLIRGRR